MIEFHFEYPYTLEKAELIKVWIGDVVKGEGKTIDELAFIFSDDEMVWDLNKRFLDHETYTDILTFPYNGSTGLKADIFISIPRVEENAKDLGINFQQELRRVMIHGVLHLLGYDDTNQDERRVMRIKEEEKLSMFHVEQ